MPPSLGTPTKKMNRNCKNYKWNFTKSMGHNSVENSSIKPKIKLDLDTIIINAYAKFHLNTCNLFEENEQKLLVDRPTDKRKAAKQYALLSSKGGINS